MAPIPVARLDLERIRVQVVESGPIIGTEKEIVLVLAATATLWIFGPDVEAAPGLPPTLLSAAMVAIIAVAYLAVRELINWDDLNGVSWGIFFIIGAGLSPGEALVRTGVTDWVASLLVPPVTGTPPVVSMLAMVFLTALLTNLLNNATIAAEFAQVLIALARDQPWGAKIPSWPC